MAEGTWVPIMPGLTISEKGKKNVRKVIKKWWPYYR